MARRVVLPVAALVGAIAAAILAPGEPPRTAGALGHQAYVWQRSWGAGVREAVAVHGGEFALLSVLVGEVDLSARPPAVVRVTPDADALAAAGTRVGASLRIAPFRGDFGAVAAFLADLARERLDALRAIGIEPAELQFDFDAAESRLEDYVTWIRAVKRAVAPVPVVVTALPSWLDRSAMQTLVRVADGWVLQVHSLRAPEGPDASLSLCRAEDARGAVEAAARLRRPFRVALPTYGYLAAFDATGKLLGISAEGPVPAAWGGAALREVRSNPTELAALVAEWERDRPEALAGVIWFRLPVPEDVRAWRWPTLAAVMEGRAPVPDVRTVVRRPEPGLVEVAIENRGDGDAPGAPEIAVSFSGGRLLAADSFLGYRWERGAGGGGRFAPEPAAGIRAGETCEVGWLRFFDEAEGGVRVEVQAR